MSELISYKTGRSQLNNSVAGGFDGAEVGSIKVNASLVNLPNGTVVSAAEAVNWSDPSCDIRRRLFDKSTKEFRLIDTGSMITATRRLPGDVEDSSINLVAVNGTKIKTYGIRSIQIKIGRKAYKMDAVVCDVSQDILGVDFIKKYKLGLEWDESQSELNITDKKLISKYLFKW